MNRVSILLSLLILPGCVSYSVGRPFDDAAARALVPGQTTCAETRAALGAPMAVSVAGNQETWIYFSMTASGGPDAGQMALKFVPVVGLFTPLHVDSSTTSRQMTLTFRDGVLVGDPTRQTTVSTGTADTSLLGGTQTHVSTETR